ncbi:MAG: hypothetical protein K1Y01_09000 [Vicinamibacteria bacterium]|nr:hypothetical protein [Vicinamibacteria bacterium]
MRQRTARSVCFAVLALLLASHARSQTPLGTAFTYQGQLADAGAPAAGSYDLEFKLFDAPASGAQIGGTLLKANVPVVAGLFAVKLDFGAQFQGEARWLEIGVRPGGSASAFTLLTPRHEVTPTPNAVFASKAGDAATLGGVASSGYVLAGTVIGVGQGGTGASTPAAARSNLGAAASGANADITSLSALSTPLSIAQGGTGASTASAARAALGAQAAISAGCLPGATINTVNADGTVVCVSSASGQPGFAISNVEGSAANNVGYYSSIVIGSDGLGLISYYDITNRRLKVAHCNDAACTTAAIAVADNGGGANDVGQYSSITLGSDNRGVIAYWDATANALKVAHCADVVCSAATSVVVDTGGGTHAAITKNGSTGFPMISYYDEANRELKLAICSNAVCSASAIKVMDNGGAADDVVGTFTSITNTGGLAIVSYHDETNDRLKIARCNDNLCNSPIVVVGDAAAGTGQYTAVTLGIDSNSPIVAYRDAVNGKLKTAHANNFLSGLTNATIAVGNGPAGLFNSVATGSDGLPVIVYYEATSLNLVVAHCDDVACASATLATPDSFGDVGTFNSIAIGRDGFPLVSYYDATNHRLRVVHCNNVACSNNVGRVR